MSGCDPDNDVSYECRAQRAYHADTFLDPTVGGTGRGIAQKCLYRSSSQSVHILVLFLVL